MDEQWITLKSQHSSSQRRSLYRIVPLAAAKSSPQAADIINQGSKIAILAGRGCLPARKEVIELAEKVGAPIIKPLLGKAVVPDDHPYTTGGIGLLGTAPSQEVLQECDTLILAGTSFPYMEFYPKPGRAKAIQIDIDPARNRSPLSRAEWGWSVNVGMCSERCCRWFNTKPIETF